jgi:hypothetical protein
MANALNIDLQNKQVKVCFSDRIVKCGGGFGCHPELLGRKIVGRFVDNNEVVGFDGYDVVSLVEDNSERDAVRAMFDTLSVKKAGAV